jgi:hypothetical protein
MRYRLRTLLILLAVGPPLMATIVLALLERMQKPPRPDFSGVQLISDEPPQRLHRGLTQVPADD